MPSVKAFEVEVLAYARKRAVKLGLVSDKEDVSIVVKVQNLIKAHDNWTTTITAKDWKTILALPWAKLWMNLLQKLRENGGVLRGHRIEGLGISINQCPPFLDLNRTFQKNYLPYHFTCESKARGMDRENATFRLYNKQKRRQQ